METKIINREKGYLWPVDKLCWKCEQSIHLEQKEDIIKVINEETGVAQYLCICKCGELYRIPPEHIPLEILETL